ncbi:MAG: glycosyltransferase, partial [Phycisphaeraceae bacterium]
IEAMACGMPIVASDVPGISNVIGHEFTGLLAAPTVDGLAAAIDRLLTDARLRERLSIAARQVAVDRYSLNRIVQREGQILAAASGAPLARPAESVNTPAKQAA